MPEITCSAHTCAYNQEGCCEKSAIKIDAEKGCDLDSCTCCDSFEQSSCHNCGCSNSNAGEEASVDCTATECMYNDNCVCSAEHIRVEGHNAHCCSDTFCETYRK